MGCMANTVIRFSSSSSLRITLRTSLYCASSGITITRLTSFCCSTVCRVSRKSESLSTNPSPLGVLKQNSPRLPLKAMPSSSLSNLPGAKFFISVCFFFNDTATTEVNYQVECHFINIVGIRNNHVLIHRLQRYKKEKRKAKKNLLFFFAFPL